MDLHPPGDKLSFQVKFRHWISMKKTEIAPFKGKQILAWIRNKNSQERTHGELCRTLRMSLWPRHPFFFRPTCARARCCFHMFQRFLIMSSAEVISNCKRKLGNSPAHVTFPCLQLHVSRFLNILGFCVTLTVNVARRSSCCSGHWRATHC